MNNIPEALNTREGITPIAKWKVKSRQKGRLIQKFRLCARLAIICNRLCRFSYKRVESDKTEFLSILQASDQMSDNKNIEGLLFNPSEYKANRQDRVPLEGKRILRLSPRERTERDVRYLQVCLRNIKAFAEYPKTMQERLCRVGWYETYEPRRAIVRQGHLPHSFYFILSGVIIVTQYDEERGCTKFLVCLGRGMAFGELAVITNSRRQATCSTRTNIELLCISAKDFVEIFMSGGIAGFRNPEQESFIRNIPFLKEWPIELLSTNQKSCMFHFFNRGQVLVRDSNRSDWIYIVKSGSLSVFKKLKSVGAEKLGNKRPSDGIRTPKDEKEEIVMRKKKNFETWQYRSNRKNSRVGKRKRNVHLFKNQFEMERFLDKTLPGLYNPLERLGVVDYEEVLDEYKDRIIRRKSFTLPPLTENTQLVTQAPNQLEKDIQEVESSNKIRRTSKGAYLATPSRERSSVSINSIELNDDEEEIQIRQAETTMGQGRKTIADEFEDNRNKNDTESDDEDAHPAFIELCVLERGQYFGLTSALYSDQPSLILASNGAECIMISKKFFLEKCSDEALRNINKIESPFPNDVDLQKRLQEYVNWTSHRKKIYNKLVKDIHFKKANRMCMQQIDGQLSFRPV